MRRFSGAGQYRRGGRYGYPEFSGGGAAPTPDYTVLTPASANTGYRGGTALAGSDTMSFACVIYLDALPSAVGTIWGIGNGGTGGWIIESFTAGRISVGFDDGGGGFRRILHTFSAGDVGKLWHVGAIYASGTFTFYLNGVASGTPITSLTGYTQGTGQQNGIFVDGTGGPVAGASSGVSYGGGCWSNTDIGAAGMASSFSTVKAAGDFTAWAGAELNFQVADAGATWADTVVSNTVTRIPTVNSNVISAADWSA